MIIGVSDVPQPSVARILWVLAGEASLLLVQQAHRCAVAPVGGTDDPVGNLAVRRVGCSALPSGVFRRKDVFGELVQPVQVILERMGETIPSCGVPDSVAL